MNGNTTYQKQANCSRCNAPLFLTIDASCPPDQVIRWVKLATCNACADLRRQGKKAVAVAGERLLEVSPGVPL